MVESTFLNPDELVQLTGKLKFSAQKRALIQLSIEHRTRADGSLIVLRSHLESQLGSESSQPAQPSDEPKWNAISAA